VKGSEWRLIKRVLSTARPYLALIFLVLFIQTSYALIKQAPLLLFETILDDVVIVGGSAEEVEGLADRPSTFKVKGGDDFR
jgi:hypothetical protein